MAIQSLQYLIRQNQGRHICEKAYQNKVKDFITIIHLTINRDLTYTSEKMTGTSQTKIPEG